MIFVAGSIVAAVAVVAAARRFRGRMFASFAGFILTIHTASTTVLFDDVGEFAPAVVYLQAATYFHFLMLVWPRMRPLWWRLSISIPAHYFAAVAFFAVPWAVVDAVGFTPRWLWIPFLLGGFGVLEAFLRREHDVHLDVREEREEVEHLARYRARAPHSDRPLRIAQITDPHLGAWMSKERLRRICERAVARDPDLVLLTGDFITMESQQSVDALAEGLSPLAALEGRTFACLGNHDYEALEVVKTGLARAGVRLLVDDEALVETDAGRVQIIGMDFVWRDRGPHLEGVCERLPRRDDHLRVILLHDPSAFLSLPPDQGDLVLSGHTHGGQLGLVSLGLPWTFLSFFPKVPDHGLWARGRDRLYVHRGTGHYGFPVRLGVPREESLLLVHRG